VSRLYSCSGRAVVYAFELVLGAAVAIGAGAAVSNSKALIGSVVVCSTLVGVKVALAVSVLVVTETVTEHVFSASRALTLNFKSLSTSSISIVNGVPLSFGHSRSSRRVFSLICSRVTVAGSHHFGVVVLVTGSVLVVSVVRTGVVRVGVTVASRKSRARCFFAAFFQMLSMVTENGSCRCSTFAHGADSTGAVNGGCRQ
jgi:hypothetical protein